MITFKKIKDKYAILENDVEMFAGLTTIEMQILLVDMLEDTYLF